MTNQVKGDEVRRVTTPRRSVLAGAAGGIAALAANSLLRATPALAADGDAVILGEENTSSSTTIIGGSAPGESSSVIEVNNAGTSQSDIGVRVTSAGIGIIGEIKGGLEQQNEGATGVLGSADSPRGTGVEGHASGNFGIGVRGIGKQEGVRGEAEVGVGVLGEGPVGVSGAAIPPGGGVAGIGVYALGEYDHTIALKVSGPSVFSTSRLATIPKGARSVTVEPGFEIDPTSKVFVTLQSWGGTLKTVIKNDADDTFTIWLTANATQTVSAAWFVIS